MEDISYSSGRKLDKAQIARLASCNFIYEHHNLMLLGATGCGKTYIACALGMAAARQFMNVQYVRLPELLTELAISRTTGTFSKTIDKYKKPVLIILNEWLLYQLKDSEARDLLEIAEARYKRVRSSSVPSSMYRAGVTRSARRLLPMRSVTESCMILTGS